MNSFFLLLHSSVLGYHQSDRIKQRFFDILSISVPQTRPAELTLNPTAVLTATARLCVNSFLTALMTRGTLKIYKIHKTNDKKVALQHSLTSLNILQILDCVNAFLIKLLIYMWS